MIGHIWLLLDVAAAGSASAWVWRIAIWRRFSVVTEGRAYRSGTLKQRWLVRAVRRFGLRTVIDLRRPGLDVDREREFLRGLGVRHINVPASQRPKAPVIDAFLAAVESAEPPILLHCLHGAGRARLLSAVYRMEFEGWCTECAARSLPLRLRRKRAYVRRYVRRRGTMVRERGQDPAELGPAPIGRVAESSADERADPVQPRDKAREVSNQLTPTARGTG